MWYTSAEWVSLQTTLLKCFVLRRIVVVDGGCCLPVARPMAARTGRKVEERMIKYMLVNCGWSDQLLRNACSDVRVGGCRLFVGRVAAVGR